MHASKGDHLVVDSRKVGSQPREGEIIEIHGQDGAPPYVVRWLESDHVATVFPAADATIVTAAEQHAADERANRRIELVQRGITHHFKSE